MSRRPFDFRLTLTLAKAGDPAAVSQIEEMYLPMLAKEALADGYFDEDLFQELRIVLLLCIQKFNMF